LRSRTWPRRLCQVIALLVDGSGISQHPVRSRPAA
jgi:hypothetical protein